MYAIRSYYDPEGSARFPGEAFEPPNWYEFYIERRLEGRRDNDLPEIDRHPFTPRPVTDLGANAPTVSGGLEGHFGHQPFGTL